ncbi:MAG: sigma-54 dependent transcriptional regulator [Verrucomicrobiota bacterium JB022]|nr:sigma-54 dependent transcriptional regulator [Verrucomicrobiota bacterium JB022]
MAKLLADQRVLVVEDERFWRDELCDYLEEQGADVLPVGTLQEARTAAADWEPDFALLDVHLPDGSSLELLRDEVFGPTTAVVVMTAEGGVQLAVEAMRLGAADFLAKPFEPEALPLVLRRARDNRRRDRIEQHQREAQKQSVGGIYFGQALTTLQHELQRILQAEQRLRHHLPPVLIEGETGTGKSTLARWLHEQGPRASQPLVQVNCATLPDTLAESELFGHEKGAFTDARANRIGLFEAAHGGTLFLDEISSLSPAVQAKVLTAIEDRSIRRVGGNRSIPVDVRLVTASLHDLGELVHEGKFREDLFHRLNLLRLRLPSLRERRADVPALADHLLDGLKRRYRLPEVKISPRGYRELQAYAWPGNLRELGHELERALIFIEGDTLNFPHLGQASLGAEPEGEGLPTLLNPYWAFPAEGEFNLEQALQELGMVLIQQALDRCEQNVSAAARLLGVPRDYVRYRLKTTGEGDA